ELGDRSIIGFDYDPESTVYTLELSPVALTNLEERMVHSEITYMTGSGNENVVLIGADTNLVTLPDFPAGAELTILDAFVSVNVIDTVYNTPRVFTTQTISSVSPESLGVSGDLNSDFYGVS